MSYEDPPAPNKASLGKWWKSFTKNSGPLEDVNGSGVGVGGRDGQGGNGVNNSAGARSKRSGSGSAAAIASALGIGTSSSHHAAESQGDGGGGVMTPAPYQPSSVGLPPGRDGKERVFGVSLDRSLKYASVAISMLDSNGAVSVYGYVPIVVAKCGMMLKETGSSKRINQLQAVFDSPPRFGKDLDWSGYSVHDAASVLRRYLNMMPEPVIPQDLYVDFTSVLQKEQLLPQSIADYRHLISLLPPSSRYLLLYLLDFLSVFARSCSSNLMTASNLAVVFQPGLVSSRREAGPGPILGGATLPVLSLPGGSTSGEKMGESTSMGRQLSNISAPIPIPPPVAAKPSSSNSDTLSGTSTAGLGVGAAGSSLAHLGEGSGAKAKEGAGEHGRGKEVLEFLIEQQSHFILGMEYPVPEKGKKEKEKEKRKKERRKSKEANLVGTSTAVGGSVPCVVLPAEGASERQAGSPILTGGGLIGAIPVSSQDVQSNVTTSTSLQKGGSANDSGYGRISTDLGPRSTKELDRDRVKQSLLSSFGLGVAGPSSVLMKDRSSSAPGPGRSSSLKDRDAGLAAPDLSRRGSEKSVERRKLRKSKQNQQNETGTSNGQATVKRSRTLPGSESWKKRNPAPGRVQFSNNHEDVSPVADPVPSRKYFNPIAISPGPTASQSPSHQPKPVAESGKPAEATAKAADVKASAITSNQNSIMTHPDQETTPPAATSP